MAKISLSTKSDKFGMIFFIAAIVLLLVIAALLYFASDEENGAYYFEEDAPMTLISASPADLGGVSQDETIVLEWNHPVSAAAIDDIKIYPSARGNWRFIGNKLIFTPQKLAAGTYYSVTIPKNTVMNENGDRLDEAVFFAFETEDPSLRYPVSETFALEKRLYAFSEMDRISVPLAFAGNIGDTVSVEIDKAESADDFIRSFGRLFSYPSWAKLSIGTFLASEKNFKKVFEGDLSVIEANGSSRIDLGSLPVGQYLIKISYAGKKQEAALTVSNVDAFTLCEQGSLAVWCHENGAVNEDLTISVGEKEYDVDERGFVSVPYAYDAYAVYHNPALLAVKVAGKTEHVAFLDMDDVNRDYRAELFCDKDFVMRGDSINLSGFLTTKSGYSVNDRAKVDLCSSAGVIKSFDVDVKDGVFSLTEEDIALSDGIYRFVLVYEGEKIASVSLNVDQDGNDLHLLISADDEVSVGDSIRYTASLLDADGNPVGSGFITKDREDPVAVDKNGMAVFTDTAVLDDRFGSCRQTAVFSAESPLGTVPETEFSVIVNAGEEEEEKAEKEKNTDSPVNAAPDYDQAKSLALAYADGKFIVNEEDIAARRILYENGKYRMVSAAERGSFSTVSAIAVDGGDTVDISAEFIGSSCRVMTADLFKGSISPMLCDRDCYDEGLCDRYNGVSEEHRVVFHEQSLIASFSTLNRSGDYFLRLAAETYDGTIVTRYIPVKIVGCTLTAPESVSVAAGKSWTLPFRVRFEDDVEYTVTLGGQSYEGEGSGQIDPDMNALSAGIYNGLISVSYGGEVIAEKAIRVEVYEKRPMFAVAAEEKDQHSFAVYAVADADFEIFESIFNTVLLPGDQILQRMGSVLFYNRLGKDLGWDASVLRNDIYDCQESDGGFARFVGGESDLLLSVLVAENDDLVYDKENLKTYIRSRLLSAGNDTTAVLACWGLCCFDVDCSGIMAEIAEKEHLDDYTLMYLAEAYVAAGDMKTAKRLYDQCYDRFVTDAVLKGDPVADQTVITELCVLLDLCGKIEAGDEDVLISSLLKADIENQTSRYLLLSQLLEKVKSEQIQLLTDDLIPNGKKALYLNGYEPPVIGELNVDFTNVNDPLRVGDYADVALSGNADTAGNSIYLIYAKDQNGARVADVHGFRSVRGYHEYVTNDTGVELVFRADAEGNDVMPRVYIYDLTRGEVIGSVDAKGLKVIR